MLRDRGTIKWTSLMLPEHVELLKEMWQEAESIQKPEIDIQEIEIMNRKLNRAFHYNETVQLAIYLNGKINTVMGKIKQISLYDKTFQLGDETVSLRNIIEVRMLDE